MTFATSSTPDITESIPTPLARALEASQTYANNGIRFDTAIAGIAFMQAASDQRPYVRQTAPFQKNQIDTSREAGEQTLTGDWIRSQTSWHHGAGVRFYDPGTDQATQYRFEESLGVDVFTRDQVTLLRKTSVVGAVSTSEEAYATGAIVSGDDVVFTNENGTVHRRDSDGGNLQTYTASSQTPTGPVVLAGSKILVANGGDGISSGSASGTSLSSLYSQTTGTTVYPYWVKGRIIAAKGNALYELALDGSTNSGSLDGATALFAHPDTGWTWSAVTESPGAVLASGYSNGYSAVYRFTLEDSGGGGTPTLGAAYQVAEMPLGEEILALKVYLGKYIGFGTTKGPRVGVVNAQGDMQYGPLIVECGPVRSLANSDRFMFGAVTQAQPDGNGGAVCIDLSEEITEGSLRFPYAWHARTGTTATVASVTVVGASGRVALGVTGEGVYLQSATEFEADGWVRSGRIRYATAEPKAFRTAGLGCDPADGSLSLYAVQDDGDEVFVRRLTLDSNDGNYISLARVAGTFEYLQFKVRLTSVVETPTLESLQVRAVPAPRRQRLIQYPLLCMDYEQSANGTRFGKEGFARDRLLALEQAESTKALVQVQDFRMGESFDAIVESVEFRAPGPRSTDNRKNLGGFVTVTVRRLD